MMTELGRLTCFLFISAFLDNSQAASPKVDVGKLPKSAAANDADMTRLLKVDYSFETETVLYDVIENKAKAPSNRVAGNFTFETLHHDLEGGILGRFRLTVCKTGNCGNIPDVYVSFIQGGNNIQEVLHNPNQFPDQKPRWNFIYAIINTIYTPAVNGEGDDQVVDTVYGKCLVQFSRPEDKRFRRKINNCDLKANVNYTRFGGVQPVTYNQDVSYMQNAKIDADIVVIDAVEQLEFRTPFHSKWGFTVESRTHVEITNRTMNYVPQNCNAETQTAAACAVEKFGAISVGKKLYESVALGEKGKKGELSVTVAKYRRLAEKDDSQHPALFAELVQEGRIANEQEWKTVLKDFKNEPVLHILANALGAIGNSASLKIAREDLFIRGPEYLDDYLFGAAHATSHDEKWHKQLMYWLADVKKDAVIYRKVANTIATVLRRRCYRTLSSRTSCQRGKEKIVMKFINDITDCKTQMCHLMSLEVLHNLPITASYERAREFLCSANHSPEVQIAALRVIKAASSSLYDTKLANVLIKIFRNVCPQPTSTSESQLAVDILVRCLPEQQHVATMLLRSETFKPDNHEKWQYFYKAVESSGLKDDLKQEFWRKMRRFKVFRPNYAHRALIADSHAHWREIGGFGGYKLQSTTSVEFDSGVFRRSDFELSVKHGRHEESLFGLTTHVAGLDSFVSDRATSADPEAKVRLSILGHALPSATLFKGTTELMGAVWNANGQPVEVLTGDIMLRDAITELPLLSGETVVISSTGAVSLKVLTSALVSLWEQSTSADFSVNISASLHSQATLLHHGEATQKVDSNLGVVTAIAADAEVQFGHLPFDFCVTVQRSNVHMSHETVDETAKKPRKKRSVSGSKTYPGVTFKLDDNITKQCNVLKRNSDSPAEGA